MNVNPKLQEYCENNILPEYYKNDKGHDIEHILYVLRRSIKFAESLSDINMDMVYVIAVYHDIGHHVDAKNHEKVSADILLNDKNLLEFFTHDEIRTMSEAVYDHRASLEYEPRSVYGKIVSSADRNVIVKVPLKRTYEYRKHHMYDSDLDSIIEESRKHIINKFGSKGYAADKMYFEDLEYKKFLEDITRLAQDKELFRKEYIRVNNLGGLILKSQIENYVPYNEQEEKDKEMMLKFISLFDDVLTRDNIFGHFSASAFVVNESMTKTLMVNHNIFGGFVYPGGHADGEDDLMSVAKREVMEETGLDVTPLFNDNIFSIQVFPIKGHMKKGKYVSGHIHFDVVYLFVAKDLDMDKIRILEDENSQVVWRTFTDSYDNKSVDWIRYICEKMIKKIKERLV